MGAVSCGGVRGKGAIMLRVKTFVAKLSVESLHAMDDLINGWIERNKAIPKIVTQTLGDENAHDGRRSETVMVTSVWYEVAKDPDVPR